MNLGPNSKTSAALLGHQVSADTRAKISATLKAKGVRPKNRFDATGVKRSAETIAKLTGPKKTPLLKSCPRCSKKYAVPPSLARRKFCSRFCNNQTRGDTYGWVVPIYKRIRATRQYKDWRTAVFQRDDYTCQMCSKRGGELQADHELPFALFPDLRFEVLNGRTLCKACHLKTDTYGNRRSPWHLPFSDKQDSVDELAHAGAIHSPYPLAVA